MTAQTTPTVWRQPSDRNQARKLPRCRRASNPAIWPGDAAQTHHLAIDRITLSGGPIPAHDRGAFDHDATVSSHTDAMERGLGEAPLSPVQLSLAGQQTFTQDGLGGAHRSEGNEYRCFVCPPPRCNHVDCGEIATTPSGRPRIQWSSSLLVLQPISAPEVVCGDVAA